MCVYERERDRETERQRETERPRKTERQKGGREADSGDGGSPSETVKPSASRGQGGAHSSTVFPEHLLCARLPRDPQSGPPSSRWGGCGGTRGVVRRSLNRRVLLKSAAFLGPGVNSRRHLSGLGTQVSPCRCWAGRALGAEGALGSSRALAEVWLWTDHPRSLGLHVVTARRLGCPRRAQRPEGRGCTAIPTARSPLSPLPTCSP